MTTLLQNTFEPLLGAIAGLFVHDTESMFGDIRTADDSNHDVEFEWVEQEVYERERSAIPTLKHS